MIDWNPRYAYRKLGGTDEEIEHFLETVATSRWNHQMDAGKPFAVAIAERKEEFPEHADWLDAWWTHWPVMLGDAITGTVSVLEDLKTHGVPVYALTNWSAETFPIALERFDVLREFAGIVVSGAVQVAKPDPAIYRHLETDFGIDLEDAVFIDDLEKNIEGARGVGMHGLHFTDPDTLRADLEALDLLPALGDA